MNCKLLTYLLAALLLSACADSERLLPETGEPFAVQFAVPGISVDVSKTRADASNSSPLAKDVTLRILAFSRVDTDADLTKDKLMGEAVYTVSDANGSLASDTPLLLRAGTYDFYAFTPGIVVTQGQNAEGTGNAYTLSVNYGVDYASSWVGAVIINENNPTVSLSALTRHCTKVTFELSPSGTNITQVDITQAGLTKMTDAPVIGELNKSLAISGLPADTPVTLPSFTAPDNTKPCEVSASTIVLPREAGEFDFTMSVKFNGSDKVLDLSAPLPKELAFSPGTHYTFQVKMKGNTAQLVLVITPWADGGSLNTDMGEPDGITLEVGSWTDVKWEDNAGTGGGNTQLEVPDWTPNPSWSDDFGKYPGLGFVSNGPWTDTIWGNGKADTGGGNSQLLPDDWEGQHTTDGTNGGNMGQN